MHRDIDTALLRAFVAVVETGSVTGAAALLNLTQAAVSQQLKRLEEQFGPQLFEPQCTVWYWTLPEHPVPAVFQNCGDARIVLFEGVGSSGGFSSLLTSAPAFAKPA